MRNLVFYILLFLISLSSCFVRSKSYNQFDTYFVKNKMYNYNTFYIDAKGDTIIKGKMIIKPLDKPWIAQRRLQESVNYIHINDTAEFNNYVDPSISFYQQQQRYFKRHGVMKMNKIENTGGYLRDSIFYIHPPRTNQFRMLFYTGHPTVDYNFLTDSVANGVLQLKIYGFANIMSKIQIAPLDKSSLQIITKEINVWEIKMVSSCDFTNKTENQLPIYNSTLDAEFCKEYGFVKMHYTFENGIKIQFDFVNMTVE